VEERGFNEITFQHGDSEEVTIYHRVRMRDAYADVLRDGPVPGTFYETSHGHVLVSFDHKPEIPGLVRINISDQPFVYEDLVEFMSFFMVLSGWLGRTAKKESPSE
jgi:hypothetical protein